MSLVQRILLRVINAQTKHPVWTLLLALGLSALAILYTVRNLQFQTSQADLISSKDRLMALSEQIRSFDQLDTFIVAIENQDDARSLKFLHTLVPLLERDKQNYLQIFSRVDPEDFKPWLLLYMDRKDLQELQEKLREYRPLLEDLTHSPQLADLFKALNREMTSAMVGELFTGFLDEKSGNEEKNPLDLDLLIRILAEMKGRLDGDPLKADLWESFFAGKSWVDTSTEGYFWTDKRKHLLLFVTPQKTEGFSDTLNSLKALRKTIAGLKTDFPDIKTGVTGLEALNEDEMGLAFRDMSLATLISLLGLAALLIIFWKGFRRPLLELAVLTMALSWTFGLTTLFVGHLNILSVSFAPLLLGMGIDYGVHWFARLQEEEQLKEVTKEKALQRIMLRLGPGILLAGFTAALSFFPLVLTGFKGLVELGLIASMGMALTTLATICFLPALILLFDKFEPQARGALPHPTAITNLKFSRGGAFAILIPAGVALVLSLWGTAGVAFDLNMLHLQSEEAESVIWEKKLLESSERSSMYGAILAGSLEEVREKSAALQALPTVSEVQSIRNLLPENQEEKIQLLEEMAPLVAGVGNIPLPEGPVDLSGLKAALGSIRFKMADADQPDVDKNLHSQIVRVRELIEQLLQRFNEMDPSSLSERLQGFEKALFKDLNNKLEFLRKSANAHPMGVLDLPKSLFERFVGEDHQYLIRVFPSVDIWNPDQLGSFVRDLRSVDANAIGDPVTLYVFTKSFRDASVRAAAYAVAFIFIVLALTFRSMITALVVTTPLIVGTAWTVGLMSLFKVNFNLANSIFLPLVVGAGVEYGIIIMQRMRQQADRARGDVAVPLSTLKGVILAGLTTTVGFGSLTISSHQGIHSLGLLAMVGSLSILTAAVLFLPALLQLLPGASEIGDHPNTKNQN